MTMKRNAKRTAELALKGHEPMVSGYSGKPITVQQYAAGYLGRGTTDAVTATAKKMDRMGWRPTERGGYRKLSRRG